MSVHIDITEFLNNPALTGIQRVTAEICRCWPDEGLRPVKLDRSGTLVELPVELIRAIAACFDDPDGAAIRVVHTLRDRAVRRVTADPAMTVLVPELFYDPARVAFFRRMHDRELERFRFIVYDLIPLLYPDYFTSELQHDIICGYFSMMRRVRNCGFISEWTQRTFCQRLLRSPHVTGRVFRLGSDGLGPRPEGAPADRPPHFCVVGAIKRHKNPSIILEAFEPLLWAIDGLRLTFLGKLDWVESGFEERLRSMAARCPGLSWTSNASDTCIRKHVEEARATVFVSAAEGFGLPPVESLWAGTPVIASPNIPSLERAGSQGIEIVDPVNAVNLRAAVTRFLDDRFAAAKAREARALDLPTWRSFTEEVAAWCS